MGTRGDLSSILAETKPSRRSNPQRYGSVQDLAQKDHPPSVMHSNALPSAGRPNLSSMIAANVTLAGTMAKVWAQPTGERLHGRLIVSKL